MSDAFNLNIALYKMFISSKLFVWHLPRRIVRMTISLTSVRRKASKIWTFWSRQFSNSVPPTNSSNLNIFFKSVCYNQTQFYTKALLEFYEIHIFKDCKFLTTFFYLLYQLIKGIHPLDILEGVPVVHCISLLSFHCLTSRTVYSPVRHFITRNSGIIHNGISYGLGLELWHYPRRQRGREGKGVVLRRPGSHDMGSIRTRVTLLRPWIRHLTIIFFAWWLRTSSKFSGQEFEEMYRNIVSLKTPKLVRIPPSTKLFLQWKVRGSSNI